MKKWLTYILRKTVENIIVNIAKYLAGLLVVGGLSAAYNLFVQNLFAGTATVPRWLVVLPYFVIILIVLYLLIRIPLIPRLSWDYIFGLNQHTICYIDQKTLEFTKSLSIWPLSKCVNQVTYDYTWTGSQIKRISLKKIDGEVSVDRTENTPDIPNKGKLLIDFNENPKLLKKCECDVIYRLSDKNSTMDRRLVITVKRPTLRIVLRVVVSSSMKLKNVKGAVYDLYGDKTESVRSIFLHSERYGNHVSAPTYYEWEIKHPKLFSKYEITWDLV